MLLNADPLKDIHNTTKIAEVFLSGKEFDRAALDEMLRAAKAAAASQAADQSGNAASSLQTSGVQTPQPPAEMQSLTKLKKK